MRRKGPAVQVLSGQPREQDNGRGGRGKLQYCAGFFDGLGHVFEDGPSYRLELTLPWEQHEASLAILKSKLLHLQLSRRPETPIPSPRSQHGQLHKKTRGATALPAAFRRHGARPEKHLTGTAISSSSRRLLPICSRLGSIVPSEAVGARRLLELRGRPLHVKGNLKWQLRGEPGRSAAFALAAQAVLKQHLSGNTVACPGPLKYRGLWLWSQNCLGSNGG